MTDGVMRMREVTDGLAIPPGGSVELKPAGLHIMFLDLKTGLKAGETAKAKLKFKSGAEGEVEFSVAAVGASEPEHKHN
jgi:copper(I)-binding protein